MTRAHRLDILLMLVIVMMLGAVSGYTERTIQLIEAIVEQALKLRGAK